jgi:hypothetical protein
MIFGNVVAGKTSWSRSARNVFERRLAERFLGGQSIYVLVKWALPIKHRLNAQMEAQQ